MQQDFRGSSVISVDFPSDGKLRSRKVVKRSNARNTGKYPSIKMKRMMQWESVHEENAMRLCDADPEVISFSEQPCVIRYVMRGKGHLHYPDLLMIKQSGSYLLEVKTLADAQSKEVAERTALLMCELPKHGYQYCLVTAEELSTEPRLSNVKQLLKLGKDPVTLAQVEYFRRHFATHGNCVWRDFTDTLLKPLSRLILDGYLKIDLSQPLQKNTAIYSQFN